MAAWVNIKMDQHLQPFPHQIYYDKVLSPSFNATQLLDNLCETVSPSHALLSCSLLKICSQNNPNSHADPVCSPISLLSLSCRRNERALISGENCSTLTDYCTASSDPACSIDLTQSMKLKFTTLKAQEYLFTMCSEMPMEGCQNCTPLPSGSLAKCDILATYSDVCASMPDMDDCAAWRDMCSAGKATSNAIAHLCHSASPESADSTHSPNPEPMMKMYFHDDMANYILWKGFVPRDRWQFFGAFVFTFVLGFAREVIKFGQGKRMERLKRYADRSTRAIRQVNYAAVETSCCPDGNEDASTPPPASSSSSNRTQIAVEKFILSLVYSFVNYSVMLVVMTYNVYLILAAILGIALGVAIFDTEIRGCS